MDALERTLRQLRLEILEGHLAIRPSPDRQALELVGQSHRALPHPIDEEARGASVKPEAQSARLGDKTRGQLPCGGCLVGEDVSTRGPDGLRKGRGGGRARLRSTALPTRVASLHEDHGHLRGQCRQRVRQRVERSRIQALGVIGDEVAAGGDQGQGRDRRDQPLGVRD